MKWRSFSSLVACCGWQVIQKHVDIAAYFLQIERILDWTGVHVVRLYSCQTAKKPRNPTDDQHQCPVPVPVLGCPLRSKVKCKQNYVESENVTSIVAGHQITLQLVCWSKNVIDFPS